MFASIAVGMALASQEPTSPPIVPFDADARIMEAIVAVQGMAYRSGQVDWPALEGELRTTARSAADTVDMLPIYHRLLQALGDGHSFVQAPEAAAKAYVERYGREPFQKERKDIQSTFLDRSRIEHQFFELPSGKSIQWVTVPKVNGIEQRAQDYAAHLFIATADVPARTCGYILDVRGNTGGNIWPMLTGLSGLLGDGPSNGQTNADGSVSIYAELREGSAIITQEGEGRGNTLIRSASWRPIPELAQAPVAVLTDDATASSGEGVAVAFRGRPSTRFFGQPTWGVSTANSEHMLSDGVNLVVTVGVMTDRNGVPYPNGLTPDEAVAFGPGDPNDPADAQVEAAKAWLASLPGCAAATS